MRNSVRSLVRSPSRVVPEAEEQQVSASALLPRPPGLNCAGVLACPGLHVARPPRGHPLGPPLSLCAGGGGGWGAAVFTWSRKPGGGGDGRGARGPGAACQSPLRASEDEPPAGRPESQTRKAAPKAPGTPCVGPGGGLDPRAVFGVAAASASRWVIFLGTAALCVCALRAGSGDQERVGRWRGRWGQVAAGGGPRPPCARRCGCRCQSGIGGSPGWSLSRLGLGLSEALGLGVAVGWQGRVGGGQDQSGRSGSAETMLVTSGPEGSGSLGA